MQLRNHLVALWPKDQRARIEGQQDGIVAHDIETESFEPLLPVESAPRLNRPLPLTVRLGFLGLVAAFMWWSWPRSDSATTLASDAERARQEQPSTLAIINPANVRQANGDPSQPAPDPTQQAVWFNSIVVVTPTPTSPVPAALPESNGSGQIQITTSDTVTFSGPGFTVPVVIALEVPAASEILVAPETGLLLPAVETKPLSGQPGGIQAEVLLLPTATPTRTPIPESASRLSVPRVQIVPAVGVRLTPTPKLPALELPTPTPTPTATPLPIGPGRLWSTFVPLPARQNDHFWIGNPFADFASNRFASPSYQFGSTAGNRYRPHHGVDISNPSGTPVQAGVAGEVVHAGPDDPDLLGPYANFYGKAVVIRLERRLPVAGGELDVFLLFGHLSEVRVGVGQLVRPADVVGLVGMTGIAIGPHLHVEVRLGANTYDHSVNPYLWMQPAAGNGAVAVRMLTADGRTWAGAKVSIARFEGGNAVWARQIETYLDAEQIGPDPAWGENGAMGDVPAGYYHLIGSVNGESLRAEFTVTAGETTFVELRTQQ
jgi:murein DD-endopeptidase MepM/ murein hydrolase activator NlpD